VQMLKRGIEEIILKIEFATNRGGREEGDDV
jgi:hypothetical protein